MRAISYIFRGLRFNLVKVLWHDGVGMSLYAKRLDQSRFVWPAASDGLVAITASQMACLLEAIERRNPRMTWRASGGVTPCAPYRLGRGDAPCYGCGVTDRGDPDSIKRLREALVGARAEAAEAVAEAARVRAIASDLEARNAPSSYRTRRCAAHCKRMR